MKSPQYFLIAIFCFICVALTVCCSPEQVSFKVQDNFQWPQGKRAAISLSFDDASYGQVDFGLPILDKYGVKATFYVRPKFVKDRLAGWRKAVSNGHEIGNHTRVHPCSGNNLSARDNCLESYTLEMMAHEIDEASREIKEMLDIRPITFAYPCGQKFVGRGKAVKSYVPLVAERFIVGRGFRDLRSNDPAFCDVAQALALPCDNLDFQQLKWLIDKAADQGHWLILAGHEIRPWKGPQITTAATLEQICQYAKDPDNGLWIDTVGTIGKYILEQQAKNN